MLKFKLKGLGFGLELEENLVWTVSEVEIISAGGTRAVAEAWLFCSKYTGKRSKLAGLSRAEISRVSWSSTSGRLTESPITFQTWREKLKLNQCLAL